jgi:peroxiredoxin
MLSVQVSHPEYATEYEFMHRDMARRMALQEGALIQTVSAGVPIRGVVRDEKGQPIQGAQVGLSGLDPEFYPIVETSEEGLFLTERVESGSTCRLVVATEGCAPALLEVKAVYGLAPVEFRLEPGRTIRGRVVDENGPVPGALVSVSRWRGHYSALYYEGVTDATGGFEWTSAPPGPVEAYVDRWGFEPLREVELSPDTQPLTLKLESQNRCHGRVTDAETGYPIPEFTVLKRGIDEDGTASRWLRSHRLYFAQGRFEVPLEPMWPQFALRVEAEGYMPVISGAIKNEKQDQPLDFRMSRANSLAAKVVTPAGDPADDALVVAFPAGSSVSLRNGRLASADSAIRICRTTEAGEFVVPPEPEQYKVLALHELGFMEVLNQELSSGSIRLGSWGRIEGIARIGSQPAAGATLRLCCLERESGSGLEHFYETTANADGRFVFERVRPGRPGVCRILKTPDGHEHHAICVAATVNAGQTAQVQLGGTGRPIIGQLRSSSPEQAQVDWRYTSGVLTAELPRDPQPSPAPDAETSSVSSEPPYHFGFSAAPDGRFRIEDVPGGTYKLSIEVYAPPENEGGGWGVRTGTVSQTFTVSVAADISSGPSHDLGTLEVALRRLPQVGRPVPDFEIETTGGQKIGLGDYRGKVVLLHFWATWCAPCKAEMPLLKDLYSRFSPTRRFEIINISLDKDARVVIAFAEKNGLSWPQGIVREGSDTSLQEQYGVAGIPASFLIDPQGRLVAKGLQGDEFKAAIAGALGIAAP